jgi:hypothetical protein
MHFRGLIRRSSLSVESQAATNRCKLPHTCFMPSSVYYVTIVVRATVPRTSCEIPTRRSNYSQALER